MKTTPDKLEIDLRIITLEPNQIVVVSTPSNTRPEVIDRMAQTLADMFPDNESMLIADDMALEVLPPRQ